MTGPDAAPSAPPLRRATLALISVCLALGVVSVLEMRHMSVTHGFPLPWRVVFAANLPAWVLLAFALPFALWLATRPSLQSRRRAAVVAHVALFLAISAAHAALMAWTTSFASPRVFFFPWPARLIRAWYSGMPIVVSLYGAILAAAWALNEAHERERRSARASRLEAQLQAAQLEVLRARVQPHFLYNTLNAIAALVFDMRRTEALAAIEHLSELLHATLCDEVENLVSVREEVALAERYLALQQMRFGDRLTHDVQLASGVAECRVPMLLLQPLVENAVVHGLAAGRERLQVVIAVAAAGERIELRVENDGPALEASTRSDGHGVGLASTRARLATAYGSGASLELLARNGGGVIVRLIVPRNVPAEAA